MVELVGVVFRYFADVSEPSADATTTWPENTADRCFVVRTTKTNYFLVAPTPEEKT